jgi:hypothetical protein
MTFSTTNSWPAAALLLALGGCSAADGAATEPAAPAQETLEVQEPVAPQAALPPPPAVTPEELMGLDGPALKARIGAPELIRYEQPAQIWQYRSETCVFDVFLYPSSGSDRVTYLEARDQNTAQVDKQDCLSDILEMRKPTTS